MEEERETTETGADAAQPFQPREDLMSAVLSLGYSRNAVIKVGGFLGVFWLPQASSFKLGLYYTGNYNADLAAAWIMENVDDPSLDSPLQEDYDSDDSDEFIPEGVDFYKMVFVVNGELDMGVGKIAAQVAHAALGLHRQLLETPQKYGQMLMSWEQFGETKIVLKGESTVKLMELASKSASLDLPNYVVQDAGRTQIAAGSMTVLGIMGKIDVVDSVTGSLKLL